MNDQPPRDPWTDVANTPITWRTQPDGAGVSAEPGTGNASPAARELAHVVVEVIRLRRALRAVADMDGGDVRDAAEIARGALGGVDAPSPAVTEVDLRAAVDASMPHGWDCRPDECACDIDDLAQSVNRVTAAVATYLASVGVLVEPRPRDAWDDATPVASSTPDPDEERPF